jgi:hypothetical protein
MINEANSDLTHKEIIAEVVRYTSQPYNSVYPEFRIPERRRADVLVVGNSGLVSIYECKQDYRPRDIQQSVLKYALWCNRLYIVMNTGNAKLHWEAVKSFWTPRRQVEYGIYAIDRLEMRLLKPAGTRQIAPDVRKILDDTIQKRVQRPSAT